MKSFGKLMFTLLMEILTFLIVLLEAHVILSIATLYVLTFITQFTFVQILGILTILGLIKYTYKKSKEGPQSFNENAKDSATVLFTNLVVVLVVWGMSFLYYWVVS